MYSLAEWRCIALSYTWLPTTLHSNTLTSLCYTAVHYITLNSTTLHYNNFSFIHCTALNCTALHCTALHCTAPHCTALHCNVLQDCVPVPCLDTPGPHWFQSSGFSHLGCFLPTSIHAYFLAALSSTRSLVVSRLVRWLVRWLVRHLGEKVTNLNIFLHDWFKSNDVFAWICWADDRDYFAHWHCGNCNRSLEIPMISTRRPQTPGEVIGPLCCKCHRQGVLKKYLTILKEIDILTYWYWYVKYRGGKCGDLGGSRSTEYL